MVKHCYQEAKPLQEFIAGVCLRGTQVQIFGGAALKMQSFLWAQPPNVQEVRGVRLPWRAGGLRAAPSK